MAASAAAARDSGRTGAGSHDRGRDGYAVRAEQLGDIRGAPLPARERRTGRQAGSARQTEHRTVQSWLDRELGDRPWFNGDAFGWGDLCVIPYLNRSAGYGYLPPKN